MESSNLKPPLWLQESNWAQVNELAKKIDLPPVTVERSLFWLQEKCTADIYEEISPLCGKNFYDWELEGYRSDITLRAAFEYLEIEDLEDIRHKLIEISPPLIAHERLLFHRFVAPKGWTARFDFKDHQKAFEQAMRVTS